MPHIFEPSRNEINRSYHNERSFADHEPGLWRAVITQALMDAACRSRKAEARRTREAAIDWLLGQSEDFVAVCEHAGLDPDYVRRRSREALARGCEWRLPAGQGWRAQAKAKGLRSVAAAASSLPRPPVSTQMQ